MRRLAFALSWAALVAAAPDGARAATPPTEFSARLVPGGLLVWFQWAAGTSPGFATGEAAEFEVHVADKCFVMPLGGKDNRSSLETIVTKRGRAS